MVMRMTTAVSATASY